MFPGVYGEPSPDVYINLLTVPELCGYQKHKDCLEIRANVTISELVTLCQDIGQTSPHLGYLTEIAGFLGNIAGTPVRNVSYD